MLNFIPKVNMPKPVVLGLAAVGATIGTVMGGPVEGIFVAMALTGTAAIAKTIVTVIHKIKGVAGPDTGDINPLEVGLACGAGVLVAKQFADSPVDTAKLVTGTVGTYLVAKTLATGSAQVTHYAQSEPHFKKLR